MTPKTHTSLAEKELDKAEAQFKQFDDQVKEMTMDRMNETPKREIEPQTKMSTREQQNSKDIYLKPDKTISCRDKFNEKYREDYNFQKEYVHFIAENHENIGETIEAWTRPFAGVSAEFWKVPCNKPIWGPRYLAEQIKKKCYHRLVMQPNMSHQEGGNQFYGTMAVDTTIPRLDARPVSSTKSVFMGAKGF